MVYVLIARWKNQGVSTRDVERETSATNCPDVAGTIQHTVIGDVCGGKCTYGSRNEVPSVMGDEGRKIGADPVVNLRIGFDMSAWASACPVANGTGIKLTNKADLDCIKMGGEFR